MKEEQLPSNIPDGDGYDWEIGAKTFTRQEVYKILFTQRAMISNDIKAGGYYKNLPSGVKSIIDNPRKPII